MTFVIFILLIGSSMQIDPLKQEIRNRLAKVQGTFAVAFHDLSTGREILLNEKEMFHAASTMKTPVMIELFRKARNGELDLDDSLIVQNEFRSIVDGSPYSMDIGDDSDDSVYGLIGTRVSLRSLIVQMITVSSNLATNILIEKADAQSVTATMRSLGADSIQVLRGVEDIKAYEAGLNNRTTAHDLMVIFKALALGTRMHSDDRAGMLDILVRQKFRDLIPAGLPPGTRVAHKTGSISGVEHDSGIVFLPDGRHYVLVILSKDLKDRNQGREAIADISRMIYGSMVKE